MNEILARLTFSLSRHDSPYVRHYADYLKPAYARERNILLEEYHAIYFPIPKVASTSLKIMFSDLLGVAAPNPDAPEKNAHIRNFPYVKRQKIAADYADYFKFAIVRNPFSRVLSCFSNKILKKPVNRGGFVNGVSKGLHLRYGGRFFGGMTLDEFMENVATIPDTEADAHFRSQWTFLADYDGKILTDYVAKFESLPEGMEYIRSKINLPPIVVPHLLKSGSNDDWAAQFSEHGRKLVHERYARDFELFGYE
jgi:hypothetical protein